MTRGSGAVLAVVAHPDDEVLGIGATLAAHAMAGRPVHVLIVASDSYSRGSTDEERAAMTAARKAAAESAAACLGLSSVSFGCLPDNELDRFPLRTIVTMVEEHVTRLAADIMYTHHAGDLNQDHRRIHEAVAIATRPGVAMPTLYSFEVRSATDWALSGALPFVPTVWSCVSDEAFERKHAALACYDHELRPWPHSRSSEAVRVLERHRGAQVGAPAAEALMLLRAVTSSG